MLCMPLCLFKLYVVSVLDSQSSQCGGCLIYFQSLFPDLIVDDSVDVNDIVDDVLLPAPSRCSSTFSPLVFCVCRGVCSSCMLLVCLIHNLRTVGQV